MTFIWIRLDELHEYELAGWKMVSMRFSQGAYSSCLMVKYDEG